MNAPSLDRTAHARTALRFTLAVFAFASAAAAATFGGCTLPTQGLPNPDGGSGGMSTTCNVNADCDDHNPCTVDKCGADQVCEHDKIASGDAPASAQTKGDCKIVECTDGEPTTKADPADVPTSSDTCKTPECNGDMPFLNPKSDGSPCTVTTATGEMQGVCMDAACSIQCGPMTPCPSKGPCQTASCDANTSLCVYTNLPDGTPTPGVTQMEGTCQVNVCIGGMPMNEDDPSNVPTAMNDCQIPTCTSGTPSLPGKPEDTVCATLNGSMTGVCDNGGHCVECNHDAQCAGTSPDTDCQHPICQNNKCVASFTGSGTPTSNNPPQIQGDCQQIQCDGNGGTMTVYDSMDPASDGNPCHQGVCTAPNTTMQQNVSNGTVCGSGGTLSCLNGVCSGCTMNSQCTAASCAGNVLTKSQTCMAGACVNPSPPTQTCDPYLCSAPTDACTTKCNMDADCSQSGVGNYCTGANGSCMAKIAQGGACSASHQCQSGNCVDGFCCNNACTGTCLACSMALTGQPNGTCSAVTSGTDPKNQCTMQAQSTCGTNGVCNGAACQDWVSGTTCQAASCNGTMLTFAHTCNGTGTCTTPSPATTDCSPNQCAGGACTTGCMHDSDCSASGYCSGGMCLSKKMNGSPCTMPDQCSSGFCADGFCCNSACTGACTACAASLQQAGGGGSGTCSPSLNGMASPMNHTACMMTAQSTCGTDGLCHNGACEDWPSGTTCAAPTCAADMQTTAKTCDGGGNCNQGGTTSSCGAYACNGTACYTSCSTNAQCLAGFACNMTSNTCLAANGSSCSSGGQCASGFCVDGVCCNNACTSACQACSMAKKQSGGDGTCGNAKDGQVDPRGVCTDMGATMCMQDGKCTGGACENYASGTTCANATCTPGTAGADAVVTAAMTCNGTGMCNMGGAQTHCSPYADCSGAACGSSCAGASDCASGYFCISNMCVKQVNGGTCSVNTDCASMHCIMGICCSQASCNGTCQAGTCSSGTACDLSPPDTVCQMASMCDGSNKAHGLGVCDGGTTTCHVSDVTCPNGACTLNGCSSCSVDSNCSAPYGWCNVNVCAPAGLPNAPCSNGDQCESQVCNSGHCM
jgi:hypothetical protein